MDSWLKKSVLIWAICPPLARPRLLAGGQFLVLFCASLWPLNSVQNFATFCNILYKFCIVLRYFCSVLYKFCKVLQHFATFSLHLPLILAKLSMSIMHGG